MLAAGGPTSLGYHCWPIVSCIRWQHMPKVIGRILSKRTKHGIIGPRILRDSINSNWGASRYGNGCQRYKLRLVKQLTLENKKKTAVSQVWRHKNDKSSYQSFTLYQKM